MQIRLHKWQADRIKTMRCPVAAVIRLAIKRYHRGDFICVCDNDVAQMLEKVEKLKKVPQNFDLVPCSVKSRFEFPDPMIRNILMWHLFTPDNELKDKYSREISQLDTEISGYMQAITNTQYIREDNEQ